MIHLSNMYAYLCTITLKCYALDIKFLRVDLEPIEPFSNSVAQSWLHL